VSSPASRRHDSKGRRRRPDRARPSGTPRLPRFAPFVGPVPVSGPPLAPTIQRRQRRPSDRDPPLDVRPRPSRVGVVPEKTTPNGSESIPDVETGARDAIATGNASARRPTGRGRNARSSVH
jgi:hypothetical protein